MLRTLSLLILQQPSSQPLAERSSLTRVSEPKEPVTNPLHPVAPGAIPLTPLQCLQGHRAQDWHLPKGSLGQLTPALNWRSTPYQTLDAPGCQLCPTASLLRPAGRAERGSRLARSLCSRSPQSGGQPIAAPMHKDSIPPQEFQLSKLLPTPCPWGPAGGLQGAIQEPSVT